MAQQTEMPTAGQPRPPSSALPQQRAPMRLPPTAVLVPRVVAMHAERLAEEGGSHGAFLTRSGMRSVSVRSFIPVLIFNVVRTASHPIPVPALATSPPARAPADVIPTRWRTSAHAWSVHTAPAGELFCACARKLSRQRQCSCTTLARTRPCFITAMTLHTRAHSVRR